MMDEELFYLYGVATGGAADPPPELEGIEGGPVELIRDGDLAAIVTRVSALVYGEEILNPRLADLEWVGPRGAAHERVLTWFSDRGAVIPATPFSIHADASRVRARLAAATERYRALLDRVTGKQEWIIRVWSRADTDPAALARFDPELAELARQAEEASPGKRYLIARKLDTRAREALDRLALEAARSLHQELSAPATDARALPLPRTPGTRGRGLVSAAAYLVREDAYGDFQAAVTRGAREMNGLGLDLEFTGPWPPYHFAEDDAERAH
jgi:hypothetical protein